MSIDAARLAELAAALHAEPGEPATAQQIVERAQEVVPDAKSVSITIRDKGADRGYRSLAATDDLAREGDSLQYTLQEGPCVEAAQDHEWYRSGDVGSDPRWPRWGPRAAELGVGSMLSVRIRAANAPTGALNMYCVDDDGFGDADAIDAGIVYALLAATALSSARQVDGLETAMTSRHTIGMAQGIVMERFDLDADRSFELLRRLSQHLNRKLKDVAAEIVRTRTLPSDG